MSLYEILFILLLLEGSLLQMGEYEDGQAKTLR